MTPQVGGARFLSLHSATMIVSRDEARRIASLARLEMDDGSLDRMAGEMTTILDYIDQLREVDLSAVTSDVPAPTPLRDDAHVREGGVTAATAENAPAWRDGLFIVPKVLGGE